MKQSPRVVRMPSSVPPTLTPARTRKIARVCLANDAAGPMRHSTILQDYTDSTEWSLLFSNRRHNVIIGMISTFAAYGSSAQEVMRIQAQRRASSSQLSVQLDLAPVCRKPCSDVNMITNYGGCP